VTCAELHVGVLGKTQISAQTQKHVANRAQIAYISYQGGRMEFKYQTLKNLSEKLLKGRKGTTQEAIESLDGYLADKAKEIIELAAEEAEIGHRKRIAGVHMERARAILERGR